MLIAREFLATEGDVPEDLMHSFGMIGGDLAERAQNLRAEHFARLGQPVPTYPGDFPR